MMIDGQQAAEAVRKYFDTVSGGLGPIGFGIQKSEMQGDVWVVECAYFEFMGAPDRSRFRVEVDAKTGKVKSVAAVPKR